MENIYHKLLNIDSNIVIPNYYELLHLPSRNFKSEVLQQNYKSQLQKLQRLGNNPKYKEAILFLKSELRKARSQLENVDTKQKYDLWLKSKNTQLLQKKADLFSIKGYMEKKEWQYLHKEAQQLGVAITDIKTSVAKQVPKYQKSSRYKDILYITLLLLTTIFFQQDYLRSFFHKKPTKTFQQKTTQAKVKEKQRVSSSLNMPSHMIFIPEGNFYMGNSDGNDDEKPLRKIYLDAFFISKYEVTNADYYEFVTSESYSIPYSNNRDHQEFNWNPLTNKYPEGKEKYPVVLVTWQNAMDYCSWLSKKLDVKISLPTEAQWEKAARGEAELSEYPWGPFAQTGKYYANYRAVKDGFIKTAPVLSFAHGCSPFGCYNMSGNVAEWCLDNYSPTAYSTLPKKNPLYLNDRLRRKVIRGGSWIENIDKLRVSSRSYHNKKHRDIYTGFRYVILNAK